MIAALAFLLAVADEDAPKRGAVERLDLSSDQVDVGACTTRLLGRSAKVQNYPVRDGVGLDWTPKTGLFMSAPGDPVVAMEFRRDDRGPYLQVLYRHPFSAAATRKVTEKAAKTCFAEDWKRWQATAPR